MPRRNPGWYWIVPVVFLIGLAAYAKYYDLPRLYDEYQYSKLEVQKLESRLESVQAEEAELSSKVQGLDTDPVEMEAAIRGSKGLVRKGETVYRVETAEDSVR